MANFQRDGIKAPLRKNFYLFFFVPERKIIKKAVVTDNLQMFTTLTVLALHKTISCVSAICFIGKKSFMHIMGHDNFSPKSSGISVKNAVSFQARLQSLHFFYVLGYIVTDSTISSGNGFIKNSLVILQFYTCTVQFVFYQIFIVGMFFCPLGKFFRISSFFLTSHRHAMLHLGKIAVIGTYFF